MTVTRPISVNAALPWAERVAGAAQGGASPEPRQPPGSAADATGALRPCPARWFELLVLREDAFAALEALAAAGCVEVEMSTVGPHAPQHAATRVAELARRYGPYWPAAKIDLARDRRAPSDVLAGALAALEAWCVAAEPLIANLQQTQAAAAQLELADAALRELGETAIDYAMLPAARAGVQATLFALPTAQLGRLPERADALLRSVALDDSTTLVLALGPAAALDALGQAVLEVNGRRAAWPSQLQPTAAASRASIGADLAVARERAAALRTQLATLAESHQLAAVLGDVARALWCLEHGAAIDSRPLAREREAPALLARLTGWTTDGDRLLAAVDAAALRALVALPPSAAWPRGVRPPMTLRNPAWARPFEVFPRLVGMPAARAADPSIVLALAVPLLFGYMFGDVGQGLVLAVAGLALRRRFPLAALLVPAGLAAAGFGLLFGSVFCREDLLPALWLHPLQHPLPVLLVPVVAGAVLLLLGLLLSLLQSYWQQRLGHWLRDEAPAVLAFVGAAIAFLHPAGWLLLAAAPVLAMVAQAQAADAGSKRALAALAALGELIERALQLAINTLSFARVGAFALAHAGLASAVVALAQAASSPLAQFVVLLLGNVLILAVEGLVVSIQTTRLVLFEFFTRFFDGGGREFRPLQPPTLQLPSVKET